MKDRKLRIEQSLYKWLDAVVEVEEDMSKIIEGRKIAKSKIIFHINDVKDELKNLEKMIKEY